MTQQSENEQIEQLRKEIHRLKEQVDFLMSRVPQEEVKSQEELESPPESETNSDEELASLLEDRRKNLEKQFKIW